MDENDRLQMYDVQAILEKEEELEQRTKELERKEKELKAARREIERLRVTNQQLNFRDVVAEMEQTFNARFLEMNQKFNIQLSKLQREIDEKTEENVLFSGSELTGESKTKELFMKISSRLDVIYSELNLNSSVILLGGLNAHHTDSIYMFNSKENKWINSHLKLPDRLSHHGSVILNGEIYIFGGWDGNEYFKSTYKLGENCEWIELADMNERRGCIGQSSVVFEDEIWVFGGRYDGYYLRTVEKYSPQTNTWTMMPEMKQSRSASAVSIINGKFYVSDGHNEHFLNTIEVYDPKKKKWEIFCTMPLALYGHVSIADGTNLIIIGGWKSDDQPSAEVWKKDVMDPKKEWKKMPNLQKARYHHGAVKLEDGLVVIGGAINDTKRIKSVEIFDGQKWTKGPKLPEIRDSFSLISLTSKNEKIFLRKL